MFPQRPVRNALTSANGPLLNPKQRDVTIPIPDQGSAAYLHEESWTFGEPIVVPDPFGIEIPTADWQPWPNNDDQ